MTKLISFRLLCWLENLTTPCTIASAHVSAGKPYIPPLIAGIAIEL